MAKSNEGKLRGTSKDYCQFLIIARSSGAELETQLEIAQKPSFGKESDYCETILLLTEVMKRLTKIIVNLKSKKFNHPILSNNPIS